MGVGRIKGITIEIGGDTTKLVKALSSVDNALNKTQTNLRDINKALKFDPTNTNLLKDRQRELADAISETKQKLDTEKQALEQMRNTEGFDANSRAARDLQTQIDLDTAALKELEAQARQSASVLGTQMQAAGQKVTEVGERIKSVGDRLAGIGQTLTTYVTGPIVAGFGAAIKTTGDFDAAMSKVQATSGASAAEVEQLRNKAKEMGETTKFSASESAEALNYMAMAGWKTEQMLGGIEGIMNLAAASGEELGTTSDIVTDALTAFGMSAEEAGRFADILASAASNANTNVAMMGESFKYVAPVAGAMGYSAEDVAIALGLMANAGIKADMAGTSLRNMMQRMAKPTKESAEAMERLGIELYDGEGEMYSFREIMEQLRSSMQQINMPLEKYNANLDLLDQQLADGTLTQKKYDAALEELNLQAFGAEGAEKARAAAMLGGTRAMAGLLAIANATTDDYNKLTSAIDNSSQSFAKLADGSIVPLNQALADGSQVIETYSGAAEAMANVMLDNIPGQLTLIKSQIEGLAISFGEILEPKIRKALDGVSAFLTKISELSVEEKEQIIKIAAIVAAVGPALLIVGKIVSGFGSVIAIGGKLITGIGKLMTFVSGLTSAGGSLGGVLSALGGPIGIAVAAIAALAAGFAYLFSTNEEFRSSIMQTVATLQTNLAAAFERIKPALASLKEAFDALMTALAPLFELIATVIAGLISGIASAAGPLIETITNIIMFITNIIEAFIALLNGDFEGFYAHLSDAFMNWVNGMLSFIETFIQMTLGFFSAFGINLQTTFNTMWTNVKNIVNNALNFLRNLTITVWTYIKTWLTTTLTNIKNKFDEIFDNIKTAVSEKIENVKTKIVEGMEAAADYIKSLPDKFRQWGSDMVQGIIDGIQSKIEAVKAKISELAGLISSYIHFSEPDVGPLSDFHTYMPDMMDELVNGITQGMPRVAAAMNGLTQSMLPQMPSGQLAAATTNEVTINVYGAQGQNIGALADEIEQRIAENVMRRGVAFG